MSLFSTISYSQQSGNFYPDNSNRWTGSVNSIGDINSDEIYVGGTLKRRGWVKFNLTDIPDNALVIQADLQLYVNQASSNPSSHELVISSLYSDPVTTSSLTLWDKIDDLPDYFQDDSWGDAVGKKTKAISTSLLNTDIQSSLSKNWFAIGLFERYEDASDCHIDGYSSSNKPSLKIYFNLPAPTSVTASQGTYCDKVRVSWNKVTNADAYYIYKGDAYKGWTGELFYDDFGASTSSQTYKVFAANIAAGTDHSANYRSASGYKKKLPEVPTDVKASDDLSCKVEIRWNNVSGTTIYQVVRGNTLICETSNTYCDDIVDSGAPLIATQYKVYAKNDCGISNYGSDYGKRYPYCKESPVIDIELPHYNIYPNPTNSHLTIEFNNLLDKVIIELYNNIGQCYARIKCTNQTETIDISGYSKGIYYLKIYNEEFSKTEKIIVN